MNPPDDDRSPLAQGVAWASRIITVSVEMVLPGMLGWWVDGKLDTKIVFMLLGFAAGMALGIWHLLRLTAPPTRPDGDDRS